MNNPSMPEVGGRSAKFALILLVIVYVFNFIDRQILTILAEDLKADLINDNLFLSSSNTSEEASTAFLSLSTFSWKANRAFLSSAGVDN